MQNFKKFFEFDEIKFYEAIIVIEKGFILVVMPNSYIKLWSIIVIFHIYSISIIWFIDIISVLFFIKFDTPVTLTLFKFLSVLITHMLSFP